MEDLETVEGELWAVKVTGHGIDLFNKLNTSRGSTLGLSTEDLETIEDAVTDTLGGDGAAKALRYTLHSQYYEFVLLKGQWTHQCFDLFIFLGFM